MGLVNDIRDDGLGGLTHNVITGKLEDLVNWARSRSSWPANFGLACCAIEMMATGGAHYDISRFGMEVFRASPRQADIMIVAGRVSQKMAPVLRQVYDQMMEPKWVISMGVCASTRRDVQQLRDRPGRRPDRAVDVYAPGCPPTPETLLHAIETLHQLIEDGELMKRRGATGRGRQRPRHGDPVVRPAGAGPAREQVTVADAEDTERTDAAEPRAREQPSCTAARAATAAARSSCTRRATTYLDAVKALADDGYAMCVDLTAVDYLAYPGRPLPDGVAAERFEVVVNLLDIDAPAGASALRVQVPGRRPDAADAVRPPPGHRGDGARGVRHVRHHASTDHPDLTRILMPEDWVGHPLRKDYEVGAIPVQFKEAHVDDRRRRRRSSHDRRSRRHRRGRPGAQAARAS